MDRPYFSEPEWQDNKFLGQKWRNIQSNILGGQSLMWQGLSSTKNSNAILRQALLCSEKNKDDLFSLKDKPSLRGGDPQLVASDQPYTYVRKFRNRRLSESSIFDTFAGAQINKFKNRYSEKMMFETTPDLMSDDIHPEIESATQLATDGSEYSSHLLSQLSSNSLLPTMTSSQVSSVLSALEPNTQMPILISSIQNRRSKCVDLTNTSTSNQLQAEFIKGPTTSNIDVDQDFPSVEINVQYKPRKKRTVCITNKAIIRDYSENRVKGMVWFQCSWCSFISVNRSSILQHCVSSHDGSDTKNTSDPNIHICKCLACDNLFSSAQALKVHYLCDHNTLNEEIDELLKFTFEIGKHYRNTSPAYTQNKNIISANEKNVDIITHSEQRNSYDNEQTENSHSSYPLFVEDNQSNNNYQNYPISLLPLQAPKCVLSNVPTILEYSSAPHNTNLANSSNISQVGSIDLLEPQQSAGINKTLQILPTKCKDPALKKFRDLKLEKFGGKKCGLAGCALRFGSISNLEYHRKCHYRMNWKCPECHILGSSWNNISGHLWREHGIDVELYSCDHCSYKTSSLTRLLNLHRRIHSEERPFLCDVCGKGFKTTKQLRNHKSWHKLKEKSKSEFAEKLVTCLTCGRGFTCARLMKIHVQVVHKRLKPYLCYVCGHSAANKSSLSSHLNVHTGLRPYSCDECDYTTRDHNNLRRHKMRHSGVKRYKCPLCSYSSIQASTYKTHILKKHPGQQDGLLYRCEHCSFNTVKKENLLTHSARHKVNEINQETNDSAI